MTRLRSPSRFNAASGGRAQKRHFHRDPQGRVGALQSLLGLGFLLGCSLVAAPATAQRTDENAVTTAQDAFGTTVGHETIGIYSEGDVRGFSPSVAGNDRIEDFYVDFESGLTSRVLDGSTIHVGPSAQGYAFPAPTGIVDYALRQVGDRAVVSPLITVGPFGTYGVELDAQLPLARDRVGIAAGAAAYKNRFGNGGSSDERTFGLVGRWHPSSKIAVTSFWGEGLTRNETAQPLYITTGDFLPPRIVRGRYPGPGFALTDTTSANGGLFAKGAFGNWAVQAGAFRSLSSIGASYQNLLLVNGDGTADRVVIGYPPSRFRSFSANVRASRAFSDGPRKHLLTGEFRGRRVDSLYGGSDEADLGTSGISEPISPARPNFDYSALTDDKVRQFSGALSYGLFWKGVGEATVGLQRTRYAKVIADPNAPEDRRVNNIWLPSATVAAPLTDKLSLYGSYVKGLEDAGAAPGFASNGNQVLPAISTRQWDAGARWSLPMHSSLIVGYFDVSKPYIALNQNNFYGVLGSEVHRGFEVSLTSEPVARLSMVAGAVIGRPRVSSPPTAAETIGSRPVGQSDISAQLNADYTLPFLKAVSLDANLNYQSSYAGTVNNAVVLPGYANLGMGARYRFKIGKAPATLRVSVSNVSDTYRLLTGGSGVYAPLDRRTVSAYVTADF